MLRLTTVPFILVAAAAVLLVRLPLAQQARGVPAADPKAVEFDRDVKPILAKHCLSCHGPDKQRGDLRLDRRADALKGGESGKPFVAGKAAESLLIHRVVATDDTKMPPKGERLTAAEVATLRAWIEQGAKWPNDGQADNPADWWSLKPIAKPTVPPGANPIDTFVAAKLAEKGLAASAEASRATLIRRLYFDLIGLPPSPEEVEAFVKDPAPEAYERLVEKLLAMPQYGERWARYWLDVVHFGETHGYDKDQPRANAWPYRDYVIRSLNEDKPYSRFVKEQVAGDVLFPGTVDGIEALGFLAAGPWDFIGHIEVPESKIDGKVARHLDRDDMVANTIGTFMGLTVSCAQCHNHKFDPIPQEDYYRLQAVFAAVDRTDRLYDTDPKVATRRAELEARKAAASGRAGALLAAARKAAGAELIDIERRIADGGKTGVNPAPAEHGYHSVLAPKQDVVKWVQVDLGESVKLDRVVLRPCSDDFNMIGAGFGFPVRFKIEASDDAEFKTALTLVDQTGSDFPNPGTAPFTAFAGTGAAKTGRYVRVTATKLAPRLPEDFMLGLAEVEVYAADGKNRAAGKKATALDTIEVGPRWGLTNLTDGLYPPGPALSAMVLNKLKEERDALLKRALGDANATGLATAEAEVRKLDAELATLAGTRRRAYVGTVHTGGGNFIGTGGKGGAPRPIFVLSRGDVTRPGKEVAAGAIRAIPGLNGTFDLPAGHTEGERRAALANWIASPDNPLTWRVMANRVWQYHFGRGIIDTPSDFGKMGQLPTHPELLDFLAAELRDYQSLKKLHRLIVTSKTYKQASAANEANAKLDSDNRYLWRQNRRKLEAEAVRDSILSVAGKLDLTMGGPSFKDFVVEHPEHSPHYQYHLHDPEDSKAHRRAVYRFVVRSKQQPFMVALDCADPSLAVEKRNQTLTPQQALALLNNKLAVAMAKHFAERVEKLAADDAGRITAAVLIAFGRAPTPKEQDALTAYAKEHGLANACRVILNLNEFVFVD
jgi:mono/diheme cytochrome c family protein